MNFKRNIKQVAAQFPRLSLLGYNLLKKTWSLKANFTNFEYPKETDLPSISYETIISYNKERDFGPKKRICYAPYNNMHFKIDGEIAACSFNRETLIGNINEESIHAVWFGKTAQQLRNNLGNYNLDKCFGCKLVLESGNYRSFPANKYDYFSSDNALYPTQMSFETSNLCNLECVMCDEELSSSIRKNKAKLPPLKDMYPPDFLEQLKEFIPHLSIATFIGGEPLLIKRYYHIWEEIIKTNPSCNIHLQTNATYLPQKFLSLLDSGQFDIGISLEGCTKETYEKIRIRGNFDIVEQNIKRLVELNKKGKIYLNFNFCPLTLNWHEVPLMLNYANYFNVPLKILNVETPRNLSLKFKNTDYLKNVLNYLINFKFDEEGNDLFSKRNRESYNYFIKTIESYIQDAVKRENYFSIHKYDSISELEKTIIEDFNKSNVLSYITEQDRTSYGIKLNQFIQEKSELESIRKKALLRFSYFFKEIMNEQDTFRNITKSFYKLKNIAGEFVELEKEESNHRNNSTPVTSAV